MGKLSPLLGRVVTGAKSKLKRPTVSIAVGRQNKARNLYHNIPFLFLFKKPARQSCQARKEGVASFFSSSLASELLFACNCFFLVLFASGKQICPLGESTLWVRSKVQAQASGLSRKALLTLVLVELRAQEALGQTAKERKFVFDFSSPWLSSDQPVLYQSFYDTNTHDLGNNSFWRIKDFRCTLSQECLCFKRELKIVMLKSKDCISNWHLESCVWQEGKAFGLSLAPWWPSLLGQFSRWRWHKMTSLRRLFLFLKRNRKVELLQSEQNGETIKAAKSLQSCPTLCDPIDGSPSGSPVPGILQARTLEWVAVSFSTIKADGFKTQENVFKSSSHRPRVYAQS